MLEPPAMRARATRLLERAVSARRPRDGIKRPSYLEGARARVAQLAQAPARRVLSPRWLGPFLRSALLLTFLTVPSRHEDERVASFAPASSSPMPGDRFDTLLESALRLPLAWSNTARSARRGRRRDGADDAVDVGAVRGADDDCIQRCGRLFPAARRRPVNGYRLVHEVGIGQQGHGPARPARSAPDRHQPTIARAVWPSAQESAATT